MIIKHKTTRSPERQDIVLHIGHGNYIPTNRILSILNANNSAAKRDINAARDNGKLIDCTFGRQRRSIIYFDSGYLAISARDADSLKSRIARGGMTS